MDKGHLLTLGVKTAGTRRCILLACMVCIVIAAFVAEARVYLRWGLAGNIARYVAGVGGKLAYEADLIVNGRAAQMRVYGLPASGRDWANRVRSVSFDAEGVFTSLTGITVAGSPLLFQYQRQMEGAAPAIPFLLPRFPQSTQTFFAHDTDADMSIMVLQSQSAPAQIRDYYLGALKADGWHIPLVSDGASPEGMTVLIREQEVACVAIERVHQQSETRITLLHKKLHMK